MDGLAQGAIRDANGRFVPGRSGNPAGKKPGTRNRATVLRAALSDGEDKAAARIVIDKALAGDAVAARFIVDRLTPRPRGPEIALALPDGATAADVLHCSNATIAAMAAGEITPDEALTVTRVLDGRLRALKAAARESQPPVKSNSPLNRKEPSSSGPFGKRSEGQGEGARTNSISSMSAPGSPYPGPPERLPKGPKGEGEGSRRNMQPFRARLLHSACILQSPHGPAAAPLAAPL
jgi:hypothetical protein